MMHRPILLILALIFAVGCAGNQSTFTERRDLMKQDIEAKIAAIDEQVNDLQDRISNGETSGESRERLDELESMRDDLKDHLDSLADQTEDTWDSFTETVRETLDKVENSFDDATN